MLVFRLCAIAAAALCSSASTSSAVTLDFDSGMAVFDGTNNLVGYKQDGFDFSVLQFGDASGANLFNTLFCVNGSGGSAKCDGNDDGDLVPRAPGLTLEEAQGLNGVGGNVLIRQELPNRGNGGGALDDDAANPGMIRFTLEAGPAFWINGFSGVDEQPMWISVGTEICGPVDNPGNSDTGTANCESSLTSPIGVGGFFDVNFAGSGGVDSIILTPVPIPAGFALLLAGLGTLAFWRRRLT